MRGCLFNFGKAFSSRSPLVDADFIRWHKIYCLPVAETDTLWISVTQVAFEDLPIYNVKTHSAEGAHCHTETASDAFIIVHCDSAQLQVTGNGFCRTDIHTRGILALLAGYRDINTLLLSFHDLDAGSFRVRNAVMLDSAYKFTKPAACAFLMIYI